MLVFLALPSLGQKTLHVASVALLTARGSSK